MGLDMLTFLKILGIVAVVVFLALVLGLRWLLRKLRGVVEEGLPVPCRIHPEPEANPQWIHAADIRRFADQFRALGFVEIGAFSIPEMGGLQFLGFFHSGERFFGCVYDHRKLDPTFDVVCTRPDDSSVSGTNTTLGESLDQRPGREAIRIKNASVAEIFEAVRAHPGSAGERSPVSAEAFLPHFRKSHADYMNWRLKKGGASREEIRRQAAHDGQEVTDEIIEETYQCMREQHLEQLKEGCLAQFLDERRLSAADWERQQAVTLAIPESLNREEVVETIDNAMTLDDEQRHQLEQLETSFGQTGLDVIAQIVNRNVGSLQLTKLGEVNEPVHAWILRIPEGFDDPANSGTGKNLQP
jgi:hypothetical protein